MIELHLAGGLDPDHPLAYALVFAIVPIHRKGRGPPQRPPAPHSLREVVKRNEAVFIRGKSITHERLIKSVAEQLGGAHESEDIDHELLNLAQVRIGNAESYVGILTTIADLALEIGERVLTAAESQDLLARKQRPDTSSDLTVAVRVQLRERLAGRVPVLSLTSPIASVQIKCIAAPLGWVFQILRGDNLVLECGVAYPENLELHKDVVFSFEYSSHAQEARVGVNGEFPEDPIPCQIGFVYAEDLTDIEVYAQREGFVAIQFPAVFKGILGPEQLGQLLQLTPELLEPLMAGRRTLRL